jgi:hypothetical protein
MDKRENPSVGARLGTMELPGMCCGNRMRWPGWDGGVKAGAWLAGGVAPVTRDTLQRGTANFSPPCQIIWIFEAMPLQHVHCF